MMKSEMLLELLGLDHSLSCCCFFCQKPQKIGELMIQILMTDCEFEENVVGNLIMNISEHLSR